MTYSCRIQCCSCPYFIWCDMHIWCFLIKIATWLFSVRLSENSACYMFYSILMSISAQCDHVIAILYYHINTSPPSAIYMCQWMTPTLVQIMACCLFSAKPLSKPRLDPQEQSLWNYDKDKKTFHSLKYVWKYRMRNGGHFVQGSMAHGTSRLSLNAPGHHIWLKCWC